MVILRMKQLSHDNTVNIRSAWRRLVAISETITDWQSYNERKHCHTVRYDAQINTVKTQLINSFINKSHHLHTQGTISCGYRE